MSDFDVYFEKFLNFYNAPTIKELAEKINTGQSTISNWNQRKSISALKKKCRELNIYDEIFCNATSANQSSNLSSLIADDEELQTILLKAKIIKESANDQLTLKMLNKFLDFVIDKPKFSQTLTLLAQILKEIDIADLSMQNAKDKLKTAAENYNIKLKDHLNYIATESLKKELIEYIEKLEDVEVLKIVADKDKTAQKIKENVNIFHKFLI